MYQEWPRDNDQDLDAKFGGRPDGSARWEVSNLTYVFPPWKVFLAGTNIPLTRGIRVNKVVQPSIDRIFADLWGQFGKSRAAIEKADLHQIGGAYYFRARRGSNRLSTHARGVAIDIDPLDNVMRKGNRGDMSATVIRAFQSAGWRWGGEYGDPMHFEAVYSPVSALVAKSDAPAAQPLVVVKKPSLNALWTISPATVNLIKKWEAFRAEPYDDRGFWAIGYGHTSKIGLPLVVLGLKWTEPEASNVLINDLTRSAGLILPLIKIGLSPNQLGAILSLSYNIGQAQFATSTCLKRINERDLVGAAEALKWFKKSRNPKTGLLEVLPGLVERRADEARLLLS